MYDAALSRRRAIVIEGMNNTARRQNLNPLIGSHKVEHDKDSSLELLNLGSLKAI